MKEGEQQSNSVMVDVLQHEDINSGLYNLNQVGVSSSSSPHHIRLKANDQPMLFEVDTGACKTVVSEKKFLEVLSLPLRSVL